MKGDNFYPLFKNLILYLTYFKYIIINIFKTF